MDYFPEQIQELLDSCVSPTGTIRNRLDVSLAEMNITFDENFPYVEVRTITGTLYLWDEDFIDKCLVAMSTDSLVPMNSIELDIWYSYVIFVDTKSTSALDVMENAIGCSIDDENGISWAMNDSGEKITVTETIEGTEVTSFIQCEDGLLYSPQEALMKSLDDVFVKMLNCESYSFDNPTISDLEDQSPCPIGE